MARTSPQEVFAEARAAMERDDWDDVFACLDPDDVLKIARNSAAHVLMAGDTTAPSVSALCDEHGIPREAVTAVRTFMQRITESAQESVALIGKDPTVMVQQSLRHKAIVDEYQAALKAMLKAAADLPRFTAALERTMRAGGGGGSVSSKLFVDERLDDVAIDGTKAWATRRMANGASEDVGFVRRKGQWYIRLFARRPRRSS